MSSLNSVSARHQVNCWLCRTASVWTLKLKCHTRRLGLGEAQLAEVQRSPIQYQAVLSTWFLLCGRVIRRRGGVKVTVGSVRASVVLDSCDRRFLCCRVSCSSCGRSQAGCRQDLGEQVLELNCWLVLELWLMALKRQHTQVIPPSEPRERRNWKNNRQLSAAVLTKVSWIGTLAVLEY